MNLEAFIDLFNIFNQQATMLTDDNYTYDLAPSIVNGTPTDLKFAKNIAGAPITQEPELRPRRSPTSCRSAAASACACCSSSGPWEGPEPPAMSSARPSRATLDAIWRVV